MQPLRPPHPSPRCCATTSADARNNVVVKNKRRAMLSSHVYPKATFVRDSFYGPLALNDVNLGAECYRWFAETQNPATGQIRCAVPFDPKNEYLFQIWDDDSSLLFVIWAAWLKRNRDPDRSSDRRTRLVVHPDSRAK